MNFRTWSVFANLVTFINKYLDHVIHPDVNILGTSALAYTGPILVPGSPTIHIR